MAQTNPNGANQHTLDPRQKLCWDNYVDPKSETFGNALQSAIKAGYTEGTAEHITKQDWFTEKLRRLNMLKKAEQRLEDVLSLPVKTEKGETDKGVIDVAKFVTGTLGKHLGYTTRTEVTGEEGKAIEVKSTVINIINPNDDQLPPVQETV